VLACTGTLVLGGGDATLRARFRTLLAAGERSFVFDLTGLDYMDSAGVGEMVACSKGAASLGGVIKVALPATGAVRRIFEVTRLDQAFEIFGDSAEASATFPL
jgi:anti-sigma B factor antagonist